MSNHWKIIHSGKNSQKKTFPTLYCHSLLDVIRGIIEQKDFSISLITVCRTHLKYHHQLLYTPLTRKWYVLYLHLFAKGYVEKFFMTIPSHVEPNMYYFHATVGFYHEATNGLAPNNVNLARGFSNDYDLAISKCFGEILERAPFIHCKNKMFYFNSEDALTKDNQPFVPIDQQQTLYESQDIVRHREEIKQNKYPWILMNKIGTDKQYWLLANQVYWLYDWKKFGTMRFGEYGTHGGAGYFSKNGALLRALYEVIGRDGFYHHWCFGITPNKMNHVQIQDQFVRAKLQELGELGFIVHILDIPSPVVAIPNVFCILERDNEDGIIYAGGAGCDWDYITAIRSALEEACSMHHWLVMNKNDSWQVTPRNQWRDVERLSYVADKKNRPQTSWWLEGSVVDIVPKKQTEWTDQRALTETVKKLSKSEIDIYYLYSRAQTLEHTGFNSVRVFSPDLIPMYHAMRHIPLGSLEQRKKMIGFSGFYNTEPHIYP